MRTGTVRPRLPGTLRLPGVLRFPGALLLLGALLFPGCLEISVDTVVLPDGSTERTVGILTTGRRLPEGAFPVPSDPFDRSWAVEWRPEGPGEGSRYAYTATKRFETSADLGEHLIEAGRSGPVGGSVTIDRDEGAFVTVIGYRETWTYRNPFHRIPASSYFTPEELELIRQGRDTAGLGRKVEEWDARNVFEEYFSRLRSGVGAGNAVVNPASLDARREELYGLLRGALSGQGWSEVRSRLFLLGRVFPFAAAAPFTALETRVASEIDSLLASRRGEDQWTCTVTMPGTLLSSNGEGAGGGRVRWTFTSLQLLVTPVTMEVTSRMIHPLPIVGAAVAAIALLVILAGWRSRRRA